jgi:hypothetical protein
MAEASPVNGSQLVSATCMRTSALTSVAEDGCSNRWPGTTSAKQPQQSQKNDRADEGSDERADDAAAQMQAEHAANRPAYQRADYADDDVDDNPKTAPFDNSPSERPGNTADNQPKNDSM